MIIYPYIHIYIYDIWDYVDHIPSKVTNYNGSLDMNSWDVSLHFFPYKLSPSSDSLVMAGLLGCIREGRPYGGHQRPEQPTPTAWPAAATQHGCRVVPQVAKVALNFNGSYICYIMIYLPGPNCLEKHGSCQYV